ncbi:lipid-A-disaccharide synthase [Porphyromonas circumdentaria]|uniref:Lipid-A-disaccharide synthase n=1 Tax=Porphyromonas circumdentaria TaxID=29524 RepID=A0A1T4P469_9PORP|nr:lipid-A-disaccharide synthase [Porphyromonas circumdentaria]MBB6276327.1 lipid-A-disaccharide synthase [Porphyromonas circumdentaria]MDO4722596.1 lipid-A-disaccharide synthase [Porphyromonas circumdentaria]SJZ86304.1 lipid-A-disaccharide synthase [Porphyromonas circumdentaria]
MRYFFIAGEASGDLHAANLMKALKLQDAEATFAFMGGDKMAEIAQKPPIIHYRSLAFMGFEQVVRNIFSIHKKGKLMQKKLLEFSPDIVIPVDFGGFNFRYILPFVHRELPETSVIYYIPPKVWAWKKYRVRALKKYCSRVLCILPFEETFLQKADVPAHYTGNPCVDAVGAYYASYGKEEYKQKIVEQAFTIPEAKKDLLIALLPGSRRQELKSNLPLMIETLRTYYPDLYPVIGGAPGLTIEDYRLFLPQDYPIQIVFDATYTLLAGCKLALVTSGTATLETALIGTPQVVCYRANGRRWMNWAFKNLFPIRYFSLVNLILGRPLVKELLAAEASLDNLRLAIDNLLRAPHLITEGYDELRLLLGNTPASERAADQIVASINAKKNSPRE